MKYIIAGSRDINDYDMFCRIMSQLALHEKATEVVCGMAPGVDLMGKRWAEFWRIPVKEFPADWNTYGKAAGPMRNKQMVDYADALVAIMHKDSKGTQNCINQAINKPIHDIIIRIVQ